MMIEMKYPWLEATKQTWKYHQIPKYVGIYGFFSFIVAVGFGISAFFIPKLGIVSIVVLAVWLMGGALEMYFIYYTIKCPNCGYNPTRNKNGKWSGEKNLEGKIKKMTECPECKYKGNEPN